VSGIKSVDQHKPYNVVINVKRSDHKYAFLFVSCALLGSDLLLDHKHIPKKQKMGGEKTDDNLNVFYFWRPSRESYKRP
jgi:hypothetical protein